MKHVAAAAGVSLAAVSLALRRDRSIPAATRARIEAAAARLGYRTNPLVAALMADLRGRHPRRGAAHVIAYVESFPVEATPQQRASLLRFRNGAREEAERRGHRLDVFRLGSGGQPETGLQRVLAGRGIRGVVFAPFPSTGTWLESGWEGFALASVGFSLESPRLHRAVNHQLQSVQLAFARLGELGYRRIGLAVTRHEDARARRHWLSSLLLARHDHPEGERAFPLLYGEAITRPQLHAWMRRERPDVVLSTEMLVRPMVEAFARRSGRRVGFAHLHLVAPLSGCSGIDQNNERVGAAAVDLVIEQLHANSYGPPEVPKTVLIEGAWVDGPSAPGP
jgi:LacI family transcriptional regulator